MTIDTLALLNSQLANTLIGIFGGQLLVIIGLLFLILLAITAGLDFATGFLIITAGVAILWAFAGFPPVIYFVLLAIGGLYLYQAYQKIQRR